MFRALFLGMSVAFFIGYSLIADALLTPTSEITPITSLNELDCPLPRDGGPGILLPGDPCYTKEASRIPIIGDFLAGFSDALEAAGQLFDGFFQLITFQSGLPAASFITLLIFVPLGFINAFMIFTAIRGTS